MHSSILLSLPIKTSFFHSTILLYCQPSVISYSVRSPYWASFPKNSRAIMRMVANLIWVFTFSLLSFWGLLLLSEASSVSIAFNGDPGQESCGIASASPTACCSLLMVDFSLLIHLRGWGIHPASWHLQQPYGNEFLYLIAWDGREAGSRLCELIFSPCDFLMLTFPLQWGAVTDAPLSCLALQAAVITSLLPVLQLETFLWHIPRRKRLCCGNLLKLLRTRAKN